MLKAPYNPVPVSDVEVAFPAMALDIMPEWDAIPEAGSGSAGALAYVTLGLVGEAGEIANKVKKVLRDSEGVVSDEIRETLVGELGDVMWYVARLATELQTSSGLVAQENLNKLLDRKERGVLKGSGDTR
jgi:NTP pyrophosphatase (non-canonical NTP hydrolase)